MCWLSRLVDPTPNIYLVTLMLMELLMAFILGRGDAILGRCRVIFSVNGGDAILGQCGVLFLLKRTLPSRTHAHGISVCLRFGKVEMLAIVMFCCHWSMEISCLTIAMFCFHQCCAEVH